MIIAGSMIGYFFDTEGIASSDTLCEHVMRANLKIH